MFLTPSNEPQAYRRLREAAGMLEFVATALAPQLPTPLPSLDLTPGGLLALQCTALADAQAVSVLRAIAKGNQAGLIASLAAETAILYGQVRGGRLSDSQGSIVVDGIGAV